MTEKEIRSFRYYTKKRNEYQKELTIRPLNSEFDYVRLNALIDSCNKKLETIGENNV